VASFSLVISCGDLTAPYALQGTYLLVEENGRALPADPFPPDGCCVTLSGYFAFTGTAYLLRTIYQEKGSEFAFFNAEHGSFVRTDNTVTFTRAGGGGLSVPYRLSPATVSDDGTTVTVTFGDETADNIRARFQRCASC